MQGRFPFTQRPVGPSISTSPVHPSDCFMIVPNRLINHSPGHYNSDLAQNDWNVPLLPVELHNESIVRSVLAVLSFFILLTVLLPSRSENCCILAVSLLFPDYSVLDHHFMKHPLLPLHCLAVSYSPNPHTFFPAYQGLTVAQMKRTRNCRCAI